jgi:orotidine-5'-phosphate decarboxylase
MMDPTSRLIVALDLPDRSAALNAVRQLSGQVGYFKIGLELFVREGPSLVEEIGALGERIFLDLKLHDIPNTVAGAVRSACRLGIQMLTLHAAGGAKMLESALQASQDFPQPPLLLAVTALTSLSDADLTKLSVRESLARWVETLADLAATSGVRGLVSSPLEVSSLRQRFGSKLKFVVPGIRPTGAPAQDQSRTARPGDAIRAGADFIVVGRPILQAPDPRQAAKAITAEISEALRPIATENR